MYKCGLVLNKRRNKQKENKIFLYFRREERGCKEQGLNFSLGAKKISEG